MIAMHLTKEGWLQMTRTTANDDVQKVPTWLWTTVGVLMLAGIGTLGAVGSWLMATAIEAKVDIATHSQSLNNHENRIIDLERVSRQIDEVIANQHAILKRLEGK